MHIVIYVNMNPSNHLGCRQDLVKILVITHKLGSASPGVGRPSINPPPKWLLGGL
jgi:hypothetical protein